jgi:hypothetical protein
VLAVGAFCACDRGRLAGHGPDDSLDGRALIRQEVPKQVVTNAAAHGLFKGLVGSKLTWALTFSKLTGPATAAHMHMERCTPAARSLCRSAAPARPASPARTYAAF